MAAASKEADRIASCYGESNGCHKWLGLPSGCKEGCSKIPLQAPTPHFKLPWCQCPCWTNTGRLQIVLGSSGQQCPHLGSELVRRLELLEEKMGYAFNNKILLAQALTHPSYSSGGQMVVGNHNNSNNNHTSSSRHHLGDYQRLEFWGDALLDYIVIVKLFQEHQDWDPEKISTVQHELVSNEAFGTWGCDVWELHKHMRIDSIDLMKGLEAFACRKEGREGAAGQAAIGKTTRRMMTSFSSSSCCPKPLADTVESLAAALFLDSDGDINLLAKVFLPHVMASRKDDGIQMDVDEKKVDHHPRKHKVEMTDEEATPLSLREDFPGLGEMLGNLVQSRRGGGGY